MVAPPGSFVVARVRPRKVGSFTGMKKTTHSSPQVDRRPGRLVPFAYGTVAAGLGEHRRKSRQRTWIPLDARRHPGQVIKFTT